MKLGFKYLRRYPAEVIGIALLFLFGFYFSYKASGYFFDDQFIYYRYLRNFIEGHGLVYNIGEKFNALSSPAFTYLMVLCCSVFPNIHLNTTIICGLSIITTAIITMFLFRDEKIPPYLMIFPALWFISYPLFYLTFGLETCFFLFLCTLLLLLYRYEKVFWLGIVSTLVILTRGEGVFLVISTFAHHLLSGKKFPHFKYFVMPLLLLLSHYSFNYFYYGKMLPSTLRAKMHQGASGLWDGSTFLNFSYLLQGHILNTSFYVCVFALSLLGVVYYFRQSLIAPVLALYLILYSSFFTLLNLPNYHWYYAVHFWGLLLLAGYGMQALYQVCQRVLGRKVIGAVVTIFFSTVIFLATLTECHLQVKIQKQEHYKAAGTWIRHNTASSSSLACVEIGNLGWYSRRRIIDIVGLVNPYNAEFLGNKDLSRCLEFYQPDYVLLHDPLWRMETGILPLQRRCMYKKVFEFNVPGLVLLERNRGMVTLQLEDVKLEGVSGAVDCINDVDLTPNKINSVPILENKLELKGWAFFGETGRVADCGFVKIGSEVREVFYGVTRPDISQELGSRDCGFIRELNASFFKTDIVYEIRFFVQKQQDIYMIPTIYQVQFENKFFSETLIESDETGLFALDYIDGKLFADGTKSPEISIYKEHMYFHGWAVDPVAKQLASEVFLEINGKIYATHYGQLREDVAKAFQQPAYKYSGFTRSLPTNLFELGPHRVNVLIVSSDGKAYYRGKRVFVFYLK